MTAMFPHPANPIVAIDGFIGREQLLRRVGCICKRKFTSDLILIRQIKGVLDLVLTDDAPLLLEVEPQPGVVCVHPGLSVLGQLSVPSVPWCSSQQDRPPLEQIVGSQALELRIVAEDLGCVNDRVRNR